MELITTSKYSLLSDIAFHFILTLYSTGMSLEHDEYICFAGTGSHSPP